MIIQAKNRFLAKQQADLDIKIWKNGGYIGQKVESVQELLQLAYQTKKKLRTGLIQSDYMDRRRSEGTLDDRREDNGNV